MAHHNSSFMIDREAREQIRGLSKEIKGLDTKIDTLREDILTAVGNTKVSEKSQDLLYFKRTIAIGAVLLTLVAGFFTFTGSYYLSQSRHDMVMFQNETLKEKNTLLSKELSKTTDNLVRCQHESITQRMESLEKQLLK